MNFALIAFVLIVNAIFAFVLVISGGSCDGSVGGDGGGGCGGYGSAGAGAGAGAGADVIDVTV